MADPDIEAQGIPLPAAVAATWGGFIYEGLLTHGHDTQRVRHVLDVWGQGCIELVIAACLHLPEVWAQISCQWEATDSDLPGVFEYEVVSPLGTYLADYLLSHNGDLPTPELVREEIRRLIQDFLQPLDVRMQKSLSKAS
jgi:hypothetical protein